MDSGNLINHCSRESGEFKDHGFYLCNVDSVVTS